MVVGSISKAVRGKVSKSNRYKEGDPGMGKDSRGRIGRHGRWRLDNFILKNWLEAQDRRDTTLRKLKEDLEALGLSQAGVHKGLIQLFSSSRVRIGKISDLESCRNIDTRNSKQSRESLNIADSKEMPNNNNDSIPELSAEKIGSDTCNGRFNKIKQIKVNLNSSQNRNEKKIKINTELRKADSSVSQSEDFGTPISVIISTGTEITCTSTTDTIFEKIVSFNARNNIKLASGNNSDIRKNERKRKSSDTMAISKNEKKLKKESISEDTNSQEVPTVTKKNRSYRDSQEQRKDKEKSLLDKSKNHSTKRKDHRRTDSNRLCNEKLQHGEKKRKKNSPDVRLRKERKRREKFEELFGNDYLTDDDLSIKKWQEVLTRNNKVRVTRNDLVRDNSVSTTEDEESLKKDKNFSVKDTSLADRISLKIIKTTISESQEKEEIPPCVDDTSVSSANGLEITRDNDTDSENHRKSSKDKSLGTESPRKMKRSRTPDLRVKESRRHADKRKVETARSITDHRYKTHKAHEKSKSSKIHNDSPESRKARADSTNRTSKPCPVTVTEDINDISRISSIEDIFSCDKTLPGATKSIERFTDFTEVDVESSEKSKDHPNQENNTSQDVASPILPDSSTSPLYPCLLACDLGSLGSNFKYTEFPKSHVCDLTSTLREPQENVTSKSISRTSDRSSVSQDAIPELDDNYVSSVVVASPESSMEASNNVEETKDSTEPNETAPDSSVTIECNVENTSESHSDPKDDKEAIGKVSGFLQEKENLFVSSNSEKEILIDIPINFPKSEPVDTGEINELIIVEEETVEKDTVNLTASEISPNYNRTLDNSSQTDSNTDCVLSANVNSLLNSSMDSNTNSNLSTTTNPEEHVPRIRVKDARELGGIRWCPTPVHVPNIVPIDLKNSTNTQPTVLRTLLPNTQKPTDGSPTVPSIQLTFHPAANINPMTIRQTSISNQLSEVQQQICPTYVLLQVENVQEFIPYQNGLVKQPSVQQNINQISAPQLMSGSIVRQSNDKTNLVSQQNSYVHHGYTQGCIQQQQQQQQLQLQQQQQQQQQLQLQQLQQRQQQQQLQQQLEFQHIQQKQQQLQQQQRLEQLQQLQQKQQLQQQQALQEAIQVILDKIFLSLVRIRQLFERQKITIQFSTRLRQEECQQVQREFNVNFQMLIVEMESLRKILKMGTVENVILYVVNVMNGRLAQGMLPFTTKEISEIIHRNFESVSHPVSCNNKSSTKEDPSSVAKQQTMDDTSSSKCIIENQLIPFGKSSIFTEIQKIIINNQILQYRILATRLQKQLEDLKEAEEAAKFKEIQRELGIAPLDGKSSEELQATEAKDFRNQDKKMQIEECLTLQQDQLMLHQLLQVQETKAEVKAQESSTDVDPAAYTEQTQILNKELNSEVSKIIRQLNDEIEMLSMNKDIVDSHGTNPGSPDIEIIFDKRYQGSVIVNEKNTQSSSKGNKICNTRSDVLREDETSKVEEESKVELTNKVNSMKDEELNSKKGGKVLLPNIMDIRSISPVIRESLRASITTPSPLDFASLEEIRATKGIGTDEDADTDDEIERKVCLLCAKPSSVACGRCYEAQYCSANCAQIHWRKCHYKTCKPSEADNA